MVNVCFSETEISCYGFWDLGLCCSFFLSFCSRKKENMIFSMNYLATQTPLLFTVRKPKVIFFSVLLFLNGSSFLCLNHFRPLTDSKSNGRTANAVRDSVIGCTENLLLGSLWTDQSSLTYVFKAALLAACSSCHGNPNAISPHCLDRSISRKLFQSPGLLKPERPTIRAGFVHFVGACIYSAFMCAHFCKNAYVLLCVCVCTCRIFVYSSILSLWQHVCTYWRI